MTVSTMMHGEYGVDDVCLSSLCIVGKDGLNGKIVAPLTADEEASFRRRRRLSQKRYRQRDLLTRRGYVPRR